jgi:hypothetical protein
VNLSLTPSVISISNSSRYLLEGWYVNDVLLAGNMFTVTQDMQMRANYEKQYLVQVSSPIGVTTGSGWYNDGAVATIGVTATSIPAAGILGQFNVRSVFSGWSGDFSGNEEKVRVASPMSIVAVWRTDYGALPYLGIFTVTSVACLCLVVSRLQRNRSRL